MKNKLHFLAVFLSIAINSFSQVATSITNGNWTSPATWSCTCVPMPGATVTINHTVTLNTNFGYTTGSITINSSGSLNTDALGRDLWINGGSFTNNGNLNVRFLLNSTGSFSNAGILTARAISNSINFTNTGSFVNIDSMTNSAVLINNGIFLNIDSITNNGTFTNNGICNYNQFTNNGTYTNNNSLIFTDITNNGNLINSDSILGLNSMWNLGRITNNQNAYLTLNKSLLNRKIVGGTAVINNNGFIEILDSYYNYDTISGITGRITVQDSSVNYGHMKQSFDFCDFTSSPSPYIDYNFGTISTGITYCSPVTIIENKWTSLSIYPNPAISEFIIKTGELNNCKIRLYAADGRLVKDNLHEGNIEIQELPTGLYFISIMHESDIIIRKIQLIK